MLPNEPEYIVQCPWREGGNNPALPGLPLQSAPRFRPSTGSPRDFFVHEIVDLANYPSWPNYHMRMISRTAPKNEILMYTDGSCLDQHISGDDAQRRAGYAVWCKHMHSHAEVRKVVCPVHGSRLEDRGPTGEAHPQTSNRAELRAAISAIERHGEGWIRITVATDSSYVVEGITDWVVTRQQCDWMKSAGTPMANRDLWERLLYFISRCAHCGLEVRFWLIASELNVIADAAAKRAADFDEPRVLED